MDRALQVNADGCGMKNRDDQRCDGQAATNLPYVREGNGMDYIYQTLVPRLPLNHSESRTYQLEMQLDADQKFEVTEGKSAVNVTLTDPATDSAIPSSRPSSLPFDV
jgi:hypothetical protein